jgi:hypothetical protein
MRAQGWRRFGLYVWDQGPGLPGDWNGRLAPSFELLFHLNRLARKPNKIVPCKWAGHINDSHGGMRGKDGTVGEWTHAGQGVQETRMRCSESGRMCACIILGVPKMAHGKTTSKGVASKAAKILRSKSASAASKSAAGSALSQKHGAGHSKGGKKKS